MSDTNEELSVEEKRLRTSKDIKSTPVGARRLTILGKDLETPEGCPNGFGTWHATYPQCIGCSVYAACFCKSTNTEPVVVEVSKSKRRRKKSAVTSTKKEVANIERRLNPFRQDSYNFVGRTIFLDLVQLAIEAKRETLEATDAVFCKFADKLKLSYDTEAEDYFGRHFHEYCTASCKKPKKFFVDFHGLVTFTGSRKTGDKVFTFNITGIKDAISKIESEINTGE